MNVVQITDFFDSRTGNPASVFVKKLSEKGHKVKVISSNVREKGEFTDKGLGFEVKRLKGFRIGNKVLMPSLVLELLKLGKEDKVICHAIGFYSTFLLGLFRKVKGFRLVLSPDFDVSAEKPGIWRKIFEFFWSKMPLRNADFVIPFSEKEKRVLVKRFGVDEGKMRVVPIGIDFEKFQNESRKKKLGLEKEFVVLSACFLKRKKNLELGLKALAGVKGKWFFLHFGGISDLEYKKELDDLVKELVIGERVKFLGEKSLEEMIKTYKAGDVFLSTGFKESYNIPLLEAAASGLPLISTKAGFAEEFIEEGVNGFIAENTEEVREKIELLFRDGDLRKKLGENARRKAKEFDWSRIIEKLEEVLK